MSKGLKSVVQDFLDLQQTLVKMDGTDWVSQCGFCEPLWGGQFRCSHRAPPNLRARAQEELPSCSTIALPQTPAQYPYAFISAMALCKRLQISYFPQHSRQSIQYLSRGLKWISSLHWCLRAFVLSGYIRLTIMLALKSSQIQLLFL